MKRIAGTDVDIPVWGGPKNGQTFPVKAGQDIPMFVAYAWEGINIYARYELSQGIYKYIGAFDHYHEPVPADKIKDALERLKILKNAWLKFGG